MALSDQPIAVLGMVRSGTSCVATALAELGFFMGEESELLPANEFNVGGYWEIQDVMRLNDRLLSAFGMNYYQADRLPASWMEMPESSALVGEIRRMLHAKFEGKSKWGWKEPSTTILLPLYKAALKEEGITPRYAICVRHPLGVVASQLKRHAGIRGVDEGPESGVFPVTDRTVGLWMHYTLSALKETQGEFRQVFSYEHFLNDPEPYLKLITRGHPAGEPGEKEMVAAVASARPDWNHSRETMGLSGWPPIVGRIYDLCLRADKDPDGLNAGAFDGDIDELWDEVGTTARMIKPIMLPAGQMILTWKNGQTPGQAQAGYSPSDGWQTVRVTASAPAGTAVYVDPYQMACQIWIRKMVWKSKGQEKQAVLRVGPYAHMDTVEGVQRVTIFGPNPLAVQAPLEGGTAEFEMEFMMRSGPSVMADVAGIMRAKLDEARRGGQMQNPMMGRR